MAKPTLYTQQAADEIIERLSGGETLASICRREGMPKRQTVSDWKHAHPDFSERFAQARDDGFDVIAEECLAISNTPMVGEIEKLEKREKPRAEGAEASEPPEYEMVVVERRREDMLGHRKLQIETRLKLLSKWDPRRYADRLNADLNHSGTVGFSLSVTRRSKSAD